MSALAYPHPPTPQATGDRMVYTCPSASRPSVTYRVDLLANRGAGFCDCPDFACRKQPALDRGEPPMTRETTCRHLRQVVWWFAADLIRELAKSEEQR